ncbi:hypothetical protein F0L68_10125 [Solihabitans fulvus]|uniref:Uncharacterized protein n=1 Tax=Solihabitans fulvus TaxID=1892852 RepID=A0A5B2XKF5_9PSEU|nr:hypothetical protein [Solihabitans fulvus]KAA2263380.1 hypothetical protein F0L68_10125 [Solihabitans fulvus]
MTGHLTLPDALGLLAARGVADGFHVWSPSYGLPPGGVDAGWELTELAGYGWVLRSRNGGRETSSAAFTTESEACAALLARLLAPGRVGAPDREDPAAFESLLARWRHMPWRSSPSSRDELLAALARLGVPGDAYGLYGGAFEGRLCLEERPSGWWVFRVRDGRRDGEVSCRDEAEACREFWRRLVDDELPAMLAVRPTPVEPRAAEPETAGDDLTIPEVLAVWDRRGGARPVGIQSHTYGPRTVSPVFTDDVTSLHELPDGRWELRYFERGASTVVGRYDREGDACAAIIGAAGASSMAVFASATADKVASSFAATAYGQLLYYWRLRPWRHAPAGREELAILLRDNGFPIDSYNLTGGRSVDVLTIEERLDGWRVYRVEAGRRVGEARHATERAACAEFWRRAVDQVLPTLVAAPGVGWPA